MVQAVDDGIKIQGILSDLMIPAVPGEFYAYSAEFTGERPLYALMKCKANKARPLNLADEYPEEVDLVFMFGCDITVCSPDSEAGFRLFDGRVEFEELNETRIGFPNIDEGEFYRLREKRDVASLVRFCRAVIEQRSEPLATLTEGAILAVSTSTGKYGLLLVKEVAGDSVKIDACHILL